MGLAATPGRCAPTGELRDPEPALRGADADAPGVGARTFGNDLDRFVEDMNGARDARAPQDYAKCAAARHAMIREDGFARHLRTKVEEEGGLWRADAVYTNSPALPRGLKTIDAKVVVRARAESGIPMV